VFVQKASEGLYATLWTLIGGWMFCDLLGG
jgi:hypothetical protein